MGAKRALAVVLLVASLSFTAWVVFWRGSAGQRERPHDFRYSTRRLTRGNAFQRREAVRKLGHMKDKPEQAVPLLAAALKDEDRSVKAEAIRSLIRIGGDQAIPPLKEALGDEDAFIRTTTAHALEAFGRKDPEVVTRLCRIATDPDERVLYAACRSLGRIGDARAIPTLTAMLRTGTALQGFYAARALGKFRCKEAAAALLEGIDHSPHRIVQAEAAVRLNFVGTRETVEELRTRLRTRQWPAEVKDWVIDAFETLREKYGLPGEPGIQRPTAPAGGQDE